MEKRKYNWAEYNLYYMVVGTQGIYILQKMKTKKAHPKKKKRKKEKPNEEEKDITFT